MRDLMDRLAGKEDVGQLARDVERHPEDLDWLCGLMRTDRGAAKLHAEKVIRRVGESRPDLLYPCFESIAALLDSPNRFILWGASITIANLVPADTDRRFDAIHDRYFALLDTGSMVSACNVIRNAWKIALSRPDLEPDITRRLLAVADHVYLYRNEPSPECRNITVGQVIDCFARYWKESGNREAILSFVSSQTGNTRPAVAAKAVKFLRKAHAA